MKKNEPSAHGGGLGGVNYLEFPPGLTGVPVRSIALFGNWLPTVAYDLHPEGWFN